MGWRNPEGTGNRGQHFHSPQKYILREVCKVGKEHFNFQLNFKLSNNEEILSLNFKMFPNDDISRL
jgi:hypothetical protein